MEKINYKALLLGNSIFEKDPNNLPGLKGPINDITALEAALTHEQVGLHDPKDVQVLLNSTRNEVLPVIEDFFLGSKREDQLFFYYTGHGYPDRFNANAIYLCFRDTNTNRLDSTALSNAVIKSILDKSIAVRIIMALDCCHSGGFKGGGLDIPESLKGTGRFIMSSCRAGELSRDSEVENSLSPFTKYLVEGLLSPVADNNGDGFLSVQEIFDYLSEKVIREARQFPQKSFDDITNQLAISKSIAGGIVQKISIEPDGNPILGVSLSKIEFTDISPDDLLPIEIVNVFNKGKGTLEWHVDCFDKWIEIEKQKNLFKVKLNPVPGNNHGRINVRDNSGNSHKISVFVQMNQKKKVPLLKLSEDIIDFGVVAQGSNPPPQFITLHNMGDGELNPRITLNKCPFSTMVNNDVIEVSLETSELGNHLNTLFIETDGGKSKISLKAKIEKCPLLFIYPNEADFGHVYDDEHPTMDITITNKGGGNLEWNYENYADFITIYRNGNCLELTLDADTGNYRGTIVIRSNGGDSTIQVTAKVSHPEPESISESQYLPYSQVLNDISGEWITQTGTKINIYGAPPYYSFKEFNILGIVVSEGTVSLNGNLVYLTGYNIVAGQINAQLTLNNNALSGSLNTVMGSQFIILNRK